MPPTNFAVNGIVELLPFNNEHLLSMERSFSVGVPGTGNEIKLYSVALPGATNVLGVPSLAGVDVRPAQKTLLFDLGSLGIPLDNVEGMTLGPRLPDGRQSLVLVATTTSPPRSSRSSCSSRSARPSSRPSRPQMTKARLRRGSSARESPGARSTSAPSAAASSIRASGAPMQTWMPPPKPMCSAAFSRADVEGVGVGEHARVAVGRAEEQRDLLAARDGLAGDLDAVLEHPALEQLERGVPADQLLDGGGRLDLAGDEPLPLLGVAQQRAARRFRACSRSPRGRRSAGR